jgi:hypothetical protein
MKKLLVSLLLIALAVPSAIAQNIVSKATTASPNQDVSYIRLSADLASAAREERDTILMLAAASLDQMAVTHDTTREKVGESDDAAEADKGNGDDSLFSLAEEYAGANQELLALVADAKQRDYTPRGARGGAIIHYDRVRARRTDVYQIVFRGRELAEICVVGDGDTDLDLYVYDEGGNLLCSDTDYTDRNYCSWTPRWTGSFEIEIENLGGVYNDYRLVTN